MSASGDALSTQMDQLQMTDAVKTHDDAAMEETASASPHVHAHSHSHALARRILTKEDLAAFETSDAYNAIIDFVARLADSVRNTTLAGNAVPTEPARRLASLVDQLAAWIADFPADAVGQSRFGNPNFRGWLSRVRDEGKELMKDTLGLPETTGMEEAAEYLGNSFGSIQRIDYGTGHELHFICFLYCLERLGFFSQSDYPYVVLLVFRRYADLMRLLQATYWLEPAGSHGVWGLDDYHFLPFLFGAFQLIDHPRLRPRSIHQPEIVDNFAKDYLYFDMIRQVNATKIGAPSLRWHSPLLDDISGVKEWSKVAEGLKKMYRAEVLGKLPIMQHLLFGSLLSFESPSSVAGHPGLEGHHDHVHVHAMGQEAPECCNMRVPSAAAGMAAARERANRELNVGVTGPWISGGGSTGSSPVTPLSGGLEGNGPRGKVAETGYLPRRTRNPDSGPMPMPKFQPGSGVRPLPFD